MEEDKRTRDFGELYDLLHPLGSVLTATAIADGKLFFTSKDGALYVFGK